MGIILFLILCRAFLLFLGLLLLGVCHREARRLVSINAQATYLANDIKESKKGPNTHGKS